MRGTTVKAMGSDPRNEEVFMSYAIIGFGKIGPQRHHYYIA
jgi:hypothetical protein